MMPLYTNVQRIATHISHGGLIHAHPRRILLTLTATHGTLHTMNGNPNHVRPSHFKPRHLAILRLYYQGMSQVDIAACLGLSQRLVTEIVNSPAAKELEAEFQRQTFSSITDVQLQLQAIAPAALEETVRLAFHANDEKVRMTSCQNILEMAGHKAPIKQMIEHKSKVEEEFRGKTEEELRRELLEAVGAIDEDATIH